MDKDSKNNTITDSVKSIPELIKNGEAYKLLISNRAISFRKKLAERLAAVFIPKVGWKTWKSRFLYPNKNIPKKNVEEIAAAMEEMIIWALREQVDFLVAQKKGIDELIEKSLAIISIYDREKE